MLKVNVTRLLLFGVDGWRYMLDTHSAAFNFLKPQSITSTSSGGFHSFSPYTMGPGPIDSGY